MILHDAHVQAWLEADACELCGKVTLIVTSNWLHPQCADCYQPPEPDPADERYERLPWNVPSLKGIWS